MPYSSQDDVEFWGQLSEDKVGAYGFNYENSIQQAIMKADRAINDYCMQPYGFFEPGGVAIQREYHDGAEIGDYGLLVSFGLSIKRRPFLRLKYEPVRSVAKFEEETSAGTWTSRTEGRDDDYLVMSDGIRFIRHVPKYKYKNVRVTYVAGYHSTPGRVNECSARLAAALLHQILDSASRDTATTQGMSVSQNPQPRLSQGVFTPELKGLVRRYKRKVPVKLL